MTDESEPRRDSHPQRPPRRNKLSGYPTVCEEIVTINEKVFFPIDRYPKYNFVGPLLGPKGSILRELVQSTKTKISILGKGSSKDWAKEKESRKSDDPELAHFKEPLHVLIQAKAPQIEAHRRISNALKELNRFMVPQEPPQGPKDVERYAGKDLAPTSSLAPGLHYDEAPRRRDEYASARELPPSHDSYPEDRYYREEGDRYAEPPRGRQQYSDYSYPEDRPRPREAQSNGYSPTPKRYREDVW